MKTGIKPRGGAFDPFALHTYIRNAKIPGTMEWVRSSPTADSVWKQRDKEQNTKIPMRQQSYADRFRVVGREC